MQKIKENLVNIKPSATLAINELSQKLEKEGKKIYKFGLGQSPFPIPNTIVKQLQLSAHKKDYLNVSGLLELREAIAKYHSQKNKYPYTAENIIIGPGSKELIFQTQLIMDGDLLLPSPSWVSYEPQANIINKKIHWLNTTAKTNWHLSPKILDEVPTPSTSEEMAAALGKKRHKGIIARARSNFLYSPTTAFRFRACRMVCSL